MSKKISRYMIAILIMVLAIVWIYPIILIALNSVKPLNEMMQSFLQLPKTIGFDKYIETWTEYDFPRLVKNTLFYTVSSVGIVAVFAPMAAYKLARNKTLFSKVIFILIIIPMMVPFQTYMITLTKFMGNIKLLGTVQGYIFVSVGLLMPLAVFMIHGFIKNIPMELEESAFIDGAGKFRTYFQIILPLLVPILTTVIVIDALALWSDVITNILILGGKPEYMNLQNALYTKFSAQHSDWEHALPGIIMSMVPNLVFFIFMQKYIVKGITAGAIK